MGLTLRQGALSVLISASVSGAALGGYERWVRQPRTPRLAVVDVGNLFAQVQQASSVATIRSPNARLHDAGVADFGPRLQGALEATARQCACTLVAMPAVFGVGAGVPDLTAAVRDRLVRVGDAPTVVLPATPSPR